MINVQQNLQDKLSGFNQTLQNCNTLHTMGYLTRVVGMRIEAMGCHASVGARCYITNNMGKKVEAEVVGFDNETTFLMCLGKQEGLSPGAPIQLSSKGAFIPVGQHLLGRVIDGAGKPLDNLGPINDAISYPLVADPVNPLRRAPITEPLDVGVRAINAVSTIGRGQRMGLFAGSGVGKSVLLSMMTRNTTADVIVVGLIGERGREVKEFIENNLGEEGLRRSVIVASPADTSPLMRTHAALSATSIAEYFRDQGAQVLLLMDSLTRFAQAQREIGLAIGEPPTSKGYPPSVFAKLSTIVERAGNADHGGGSITAFYTVLVEGDDHNEPVADSARAILDGHITLSRKIADTGLYPAIDIEGSISRVLPNVTTDQQRTLIQRLRSVYAKFQQNKDLISIGAYAKGSDPEIDYAMQKMPEIIHFLKQDIYESADMLSSFQQLERIFGANLNELSHVTS